MKLIRTKLNGRKFWYWENDRYIGQRIALGKYEPYLTKLILRQAQHGDVVIDVGANIGYYTILLAKNAKTVMGIEPEEKTFEILTKNCEGLKNVRLIRAAAGSKDGEAELVRSEENYGDNRINPSKSPFDKGDLVQCIRLDNLIKERVDLMKIDVQGWESEVIEGAKKVIEKYKPTIFFELSKKENYERDKKMWLFLKKVYKKIYFVDEYIQIYYPVSFAWAKNYIEKKEQGNLVVFQENNFKTKWGGIRDFWLKKWVKRKMGRLET
jgi:FkbM family methyltransferase